MAASHFFVGLGAGIALLTLPVVVLAPGLDVPGRFSAWMNPPVTSPATQVSAAANRPVRGYVPGEPTPGPQAPPPTLAPIVKPTAASRPLSTPAVAAPSGALRTGVIRSGGQPATVHRVVGVDSPDDPTLADGSPVLVSAGSDLQQSGQNWRAVRGLGGIVGWVAAEQVTIDQ